jgi:hypothetical protein
MRNLFTSLSLSSLLLLPASGFALEGIGPRVTVVGTVESVQLSDTQMFDQVGGEYVVTARNGQKVTVVLQDDAKIISEGRMSRKSLLPVNVVPGMQVRVRGWRVSSNALTASLVIIVNIELNPALSVNGILQSVTENQITVLTQDGQSRSYDITSGTEINVNYSLNGNDGLTLIGKQAILTLNPLDSTQVRIVRITGNPTPVFDRPSSRDLRVR